MKTVKEKALEQAFLRVMSKVIGGKEAFLRENTNCVGAIEDIDTRLAELQQELMGLVRRMGVGNKAYLTLVAEIERLR